MKSLLFVTFFLCACSASPKRPKTYTPAPSLSDVRRSVVDAKDFISRSRTLNQQIEDKLIMLRDLK